ncbi:MAG: hypothetical protein ACTHLX_07235 [Candidatus Binatia bacterium]
MAADEDLMSAVLELFLRNQVEAKEIVDFLAELRMLHVPEREIRASLRKLGTRWKQIQTLTRQAIRKSELYLGNQRQRAVEIENTAHFFSKFFSTPKAKRPLETEIADCKESIISFLRRHNIRAVNQYGWIVKSSIGELWTAGDGKDQIEPFRQIPQSCRGKIPKIREVPISGFPVSQVGFVSRNPSNYAKC